MGIKKLEAVLRDQIDLYRRMFEAFAAPDDPADAPCQHEWRDLPQEGSTVERGCAKCGEIELATDTRMAPIPPAPPTPEQLGDFELTGEYRNPKKGEWFVSTDQGNPLFQYPIDSAEIIFGPRWIVRPKKPAPWKPTLPCWVFSKKTGKVEYAQALRNDWYYNEPPDMGGDFIGTLSDLRPATEEEMRLGAERNIAEAVKPAPWVPKVGEWWWHNNWARPVKIISVDPVMISVAAYLDGKPFESGPDYIKHKCTPEEMFKPGAKVRYKDAGGLEVVGFVQRRLYDEAKEIEIVGLYPCTSRTEHLTLLEPANVRFTRTRNPCGFGSS